MRSIRLFIGALVFWIVVAIIVFLVFAFSGAYEVGADVPHWDVTSYVIGKLRDRAVDQRAADIQTPPLDEPAMVREGAEHYAAMCAGCHLSPGMGHSELRDGLYPKPPNLTHFAPRPAQAFWVIKHGLKMTAMPAWGKTHDDQTIWAIVAYLQKQPRMSAAEFQRLTEGVTAMHDHHDHDAALSGATAPAAASAAAEGGPAVPVAPRAPPSAAPATSASAPVAAGSSH